jgi:hypothetical protein
MFACYKYIALDKDHLWLAATETKLRIEKSRNAERLTAQR